MFTSKRSAIRLFEIQEKYTCATLGCFSESALSRNPVEGFRSVAELAVHGIIVRESSLASILADDSMLLNLKTRFPAGEKIQSITPSELLELRHTSFEIFCAGIEQISWDELDKPFRTHFGNLSTARNYLTIVLQEEIHHRGQMILIARLYGLTPPETPYEELAEMDVAQ